MNTLKKINPETIFNPNNWTKRIYSTSEYINHNNLLNQTNSTNPTNLTKPTKFIRIRADISMYGTKSVGLVQNPKLIIELNSCEQISPINLNNIFNIIYCQINGHDVERLEDSETIQMLNSYYGYEVVQIGNKIFFPIPLNLFLGGFISGTMNLKNSHVVFVVGFNSLNPIYTMCKKITLEIDQYVGDIQFNLDCSAKIKNELIPNIDFGLFGQFMLNNSDYKTILINKQNDLKTILNNSNTCLSKYEYSELIQIDYVSDSKFSSPFNSEIWFEIPKHSSKLNELFFYFKSNSPDLDINNIIESDIFESVEFRVNGIPLFTRDWAELSYDLECSNIKLLKGVFRIPFENIFSSQFEFNNMMYDQNSFNHLTSIYTINIRMKQSLNVVAPLPYQIKIFGLYSDDMIHWNNDDNKGFFNVCENKIIKWYDCF